MRPFACELGARWSWTWTPFEVPDKMLGNGTLDLAIGHYEDVPAHLRAMTLYESRLVAVARAAHPTIKARMTLSQFVQAPQVVVFKHSAAVEEGLRQVFIASAQPFKLAASVQQVSLALAVVERTDAVSQVTERIARL